MFGSIFSDRYNRKRDIFYAQYEETRSRFPNLPFYKRPEEPLKSKSTQRSRKKRRHTDHDYDEWIAGNFVSIVVRRTVEQWSGRQLMELAPIHSINVCSWRSWPRENDEGKGEGEGEETQALRRSVRLTDKTNLKHIGNSRQLDTEVAIKWQQRLPTLELEIKHGNTAGEKLEATFIDGCCHISVQQCNMCGRHFGKARDLQRHSLYDCRRNLLATLGN